MLDASAILAFLLDERGADIVEPLIPGSLISSVNWVEVAQSLLDIDAQPCEARRRLSEHGLEVVPLATEDAERAAALRSVTRQAGLSLADRCCLALADRRGCPAVTADVAWSSVDVPAAVRLIR